MAKFVQVTAVPTGNDFTLFGIDTRGYVWRLDPGQPKWQEVTSETEGDRGGVTGINIILQTPPQEGKEGA